MKAHYLQPGVGHYGVFNGSRFRSEIAPRIADFVLSHNGRAAQRRRASASAIRRQRDSPAAIWRRASWQR